MANVETHLAEDAIRLRSYQIWQREGCLQGNAVEHWLRAIAELEAELSAKTPPLEGQQHADDEAQANARKQASGNTCSGAMSANI